MHPSLSLEAAVCRYVFVECPLDLPPWIDAIYTGIIHQSDETAVALAVREMEEV